MSRHKNYILVTSILMALTLISFQNCGGFQAIGLKSADVSSIFNLKRINCDQAVEPNLISETCIGVSPTEYANLQEYEPQYALYSDGATKRRWIYLPENSIIDSKDLDSWLYPVGTILWKEFALDGRRIETRQFKKVSDNVGPSAWEAKVFLWREDQSDAVLIKSDVKSLTADQLARFEAGRVVGRYSLISQSSCVQCHQGAKDNVLGFNYLQLSITSEKLNVGQLSALAWLTDPPKSLDTIAGNESDRKAIGYLQSNCATCHSPTGIFPSVDFKHKSAARDLASESVIRSAVDRPGLISPGKPADSRLTQRMKSGSMPPSSTAQLHSVDTEGLQTLENWIAQLQPFPAP